MMSLPSFLKTSSLASYLAYNCRSEKKSLIRLGWKGLTENKLLFLSVLIGFLLQMMIVYVPFFQPIFHTTALSVSDMIIVLACFSIGIAIFPELFIFRN